MQRQTIMSKKDLNNKNNKTNKSNKFRLIRLHIKYMVHQPLNKINFTHDR